MIQRILAAADIKRVAICQECFSTKLTNIVSDNFRILWTEIGKIAEFTKVNLYGSLLILKTDLFKSSLLHKPMQLLRKRLGGGGMKVSEIDI